GDLLLFGADKEQVVYDSLGALRLKLAKQLDLIDESKYNFLWVVDWPLLEYDEDAKRYTAAHHPFTSPVEADIEKLTEHQEKVLAIVFSMFLMVNDFVGGSARFHQKEIQVKWFVALGLSEDSVVNHFDS